MNTIAEDIAAVDGALENALARVQAEVLTLTPRIASILARIARDGATPAETAALDRLQAKLDALDPFKPHTLS